MVTPGYAQETPPKSSLKTQTDVILFIQPDSPSTARIGLSYRKRIPHTQVLKEIKSLLAASGWKLSETPSITDKSVRPENPQRFPPVTGAEFSVADAPQFHDNAPLLAPYLKAFQAWDHLEILFVTTDLVPYNGVTNFRSSDLDVTLAKSDGIYDFLVTIRGHSKDLPPLIAGSNVAGQEAGKTLPNAAPEQAPHSSTLTTGQNSNGLFWPILLILVGSLLAGSVALYLLSKRHQENLKPGRLR